MFLGNLMLCAFSCDVGLGFEQNLCYQRIVVAKSPAQAKWGH